MEKEIRRLQCTDESKFRLMIAELGKDGWEVEEETKRKDGSGMLYCARLARGKVENHVP